MIINKEKIALGQHKLIRMRVSKLPSGTPISIQANVYRSLKEGPTVLLLGGVHGDEVNGVETIRRLIDGKIFENLEKGTVIAIPVLNVYGFINFSREVPDGKDINRSFPGSTNGSLASRVAHTLTKEILPHVDVVIDFHTGGNKIYNVPQVRVTKNDLEDEKLAHVFGAPFVIHAGLIAKSLRKQVKKANKAVLVFEGGESLRLNEDAINSATKGVENVLKYLGVLSGDLPKSSSTIIKTGYWERAPKSGIFTKKVKAGEYVAKQTIIGEISAPYGGETVLLKSKKEGFIYGFNNNPVVNQGDALFHIGQTG